MAISLGSLKDHSLSAAAMKAGVPAGSYKSKLIALAFESSKTGKRMVCSEWLILATLDPKAIDVDANGVDKYRGKKVKLRFVIEGNGSEFALANLGAHMQEICNETGHDLGVYVTDVDYDQLFLELASFTVIKELVGKVNPKNAQYPQWNIKKDRTAVVAPASVTATQWAQHVIAAVETVSVQAAPTPDPVAVVQPKSAASNLFGED